MTKKDNKKAHNSDTLAGDELQALQSADADQHRDRITRFGLLKHRSKLQEQYLWTQVDFTAEGENEESNKALKAATKLKAAANFCYSVITTLLTKSSSKNSTYADSICFALCVLVFVLHVQ